MPEWIDSAFGWYDDVSGSIERDEAKRAIKEGLVTHSVRLWFRSGDRYEVESFNSEGETFTARRSEVNPSQEPNRK